MEEKRGLISIVGCGPGAPDHVTPAARRIVEDAEVLMGAERLLDLFPDSAAEKVALGSTVSQALERLDTLAGDRSVAVLVSGDPGLFSLAKLVIARFGRDRCRPIPGISSLQVAFARIGLDWADALIISTHKEYPQQDPRWKAAKKIAVFCGRKGSLQWIADNVAKDRPDDRTVFVMENLTLEDERIRECAFEDLRTSEASSRTIVLLIDKDLQEWAPEHSME